MSQSIHLKSAKQRANIAINLIMKDETDCRKFDDCFEMGDGDEVMNIIIEKARTNGNLAEALSMNAPHLGSGDFNKRMYEAIQECFHSL